jgi:hypothetical protein
MKQESAIQDEIVEAGKKFNASKLDVQKAEEEYSRVQTQYSKELNATESEKLAYMRQQSLETNAQLASFGILGNLVNAVLVPLQLMASVMGVINTLTSVFVALKKKEGQETDKNTRKTLAQAAAEKIKAAFGMAGSAAAIPYAGWIIAGLILASLLGLVIAGAVATANAHETSTDSVEGNVKAMQKLQAEIYNLGNTLNTVSSLSEEFDSLSAKINKTADDTKRLQEIITEFNDTAGYDLLDSSMTYEEVLQKMRAYEAAVTADLYNQVQESNQILKEALAQTAEIKTAYRVKTKPNTPLEIIYPYEKTSEYILVKKQK